MKSGRVLQNLEPKYGTKYNITILSPYRVVVFKEMNRSSLVAWRVPNLLRRRVWSETVMKPAGESYLNG